MANHAGFGKLPAIVISSISNSPFLYLRHWRLARRAASPGRSTLPGAVRDVWLRFATTSAHRSARSRVWLAWRASPSRLANFRRLIEKCRFAADSPLEESGFEPLVPLATEMLVELARGISNATRMLAVGDIGPMPRLC